MQAEETNLNLVSEAAFRVAHLRKPTSFFVVGERCFGTNFLKALIEENLDLFATYEYGRVTRENFEIIDVFALRTDGPFDARCPAIVACSGSETGVASIDAGSIDNLMANL